jgi:hypothetical protein
MNYIYVSAIIGAGSLLANLGQLQEAVTGDEDPRKYGGIGWASQKKWPTMSH